MNKLNLKLEYPDNRTMVLSVSINKDYKSINYRHMSNDEIPLKIQKLMLSEMLVKLSKDSIFDFNNEEPLEERKS